MEENPLQQEIFALISDKHRIKPRKISIWREHQ